MMPAPRELLMRQASRDGRPVAVLRAVDHGDGCVVEAEVYPAGGSPAVRPGPYAFADARQAAAFVSEVADALMYLGCDLS